MSDLHMGTSGLRVSQYALNTTAHNLANVDTEGFVRQQTLLQDTQYLKQGWTSFNTLQSGLGVSTQVVRQVRDVFLDKSYRQESGRKGFYTSQYETINEIENLFGELQGVAFQNSIEDFWISLQEISKQPDSLVARASFIETSVSFIERAENISNQLKKYQVNLNTQIRDNVERVNEIGARITTLNNSISFYECSTIEHANDLRDERNLLLDELSKLVKIKYREAADGRVSVSIEGVAFVTDDFFYKMSTETVLERYMRENPYADLSQMANNDNSSMLIPIWPAYGNDKVFNFDVVPDSAANTDIGSLKGLLLARGEKAANYLDIPIMPSKEDYTDTDGLFDEDEYNAALTEYDAGVYKYNKNIAPSVIQTVQAQFDQLIHSVVTMINDCLCPNKEVTLMGGETVTYSDGSVRTYEDGVKIYILDEENAGIGMDGPPGTKGEELFSRKSQPRYSEPGEITIMHADGTVETLIARIYVEEDKTNNYTLYTLGEIRINQAILENKSKLPISANTETGDYDIKKIEELITKWQEPLTTLSPNTLTKNTVTEYYNSFISELAVWGERLNKTSQNQDTLVLSINNERQQLMGVSSDEELTNIIKYQHAYNAAARYINVINEMLEHIITRL